MPYPLTCIVGLVCLFIYPEPPILILPGITLISGSDAGHGGELEPAGRSEKGMIDVYTISVSLICAPTF
jgi:hypothetical protein